MQAVADLITISAETDVLERTTAQITIEPIGENALVGATELAGTGKYAAAVNEDRQVERLAVFERKGLGGEFCCAVERNGSLGAEGFVNAGSGKAVREFRAAGGLEGVGDWLNREVGQRWDRIDAARAEQDESGAVLLAVFEHVDRADKVVVDELSRTGFAVDAGEHTGIRSSIDDKLSGGQSVYCGGVAQISGDDFGAEFLQRLSVGFAAGADEVVEACDLVADGNQLTGERAANETADSGDEDAHKERDASGLRATFPSLDDLADGFFERLGDVPIWIVGAHFAEIGVVTNVVADAVLVDVRENLRFAGELFGNLERFEDRGAVGFATAEIVNLGHARGVDEGGHEAGDIERVDIIAHLFAFVAENLVLAAFEVALHEVAEEAVQFDAGVVRTGQTTAAQAAGGHVEITAVLLHHDIGGDFGRTEERVLGLVDGERFGDAVLVGGVGIVPAGGEFL